MNRRRFIGNVSKTGALAVFLGNIPVRLLALDKNTVNALMDANSDRVLILIQMHGGNDGLNTVIPIDQYSVYYNLRPNIALSDTGSRKILTLSDSIGIHPDMNFFKELYDQGRASIVQNVGYENMNLSHFRGRDIMFMGGGSNDYYNSGWMGRFLDKEYPGYPENYPTDTMKDPLALEIGSSFSLAFHREDGIPVGFNVQSPQQFYDLISGVGVQPPIAFPDSHAGDELRYLMEFEKQSNVYAGRLKDVYNAGHNTAGINYPETYPLNADPRFVNNPLSGQLQLIARLLSGGIKTRIFLTRIGGFDTHAEQVEQYNTSLGGHAALLYHISAAMKAFQDDLAGQGLEDKVLSMTFTEFGRRAFSNASYGTDHGKSFPTLMFGSALKGGIIGANVNLSDLDNGNLRYTVDYRQVYTTVLSDWFGASNQTLTDIYFGDWVDKKVDLIEDSMVLSDKTVKSFEISKFYPNPVRDIANVVLKLNYPSDVILRVYDTAGRLLIENDLGIQNAGYLQADFSVSGLPAGIYQCYVIAGNDKLVRKFYKK